MIFHSIKERISLLKKLWLDLNNRKITVERHIPFLNKYKCIPSEHLKQVIQHIEFITDIEQQKNMYIELDV